MYSVLIADDEDIIRNGFIDFVPWNDLGFEVVYTCENADQVFKYLQNHTVDFILTDIVMVGHTGLDIGKYIYENHLPTIVCLISGHRNFEYAREAMKYNIKYYLTKPTDFNDVSEMLKDVKKTLDERKSQDDDIIENARSELFFDIFAGNCKNASEISIAAKRAGLDPTSVIIAPFWITVNNFDAYVAEKWNYGKEMLFSAIYNFLRENLKQFSIYSITILNNEDLFIAVSSNAKNIDPEILKNNLSAAKDAILYVMGLEIDYQLGNTFDNLYDFFSHFTNNQSSFHGKSILHEMYKNIIFSLVLGNTERLNTVLSNVFSSLGQKDVEMLRSDFTELFEIISDKLKISATKGFADICEAYISRVKDAATSEEIMTVTKEFLIKISENINQKNSPSSIIIEKAKSYIDEHFSENISLYDVANYVFLNASYLSRLFKQYTGENFRDYLINIRISHAIELMEQNKYKIYEISQMCGYNNPKYFTQQFKQVTSLSPTEYLAQKGH